jgi:hypothetical protein
VRERVRSSLFLFFAGFVSSSMVFAVSVLILIPSTRWNGRNSEEGGAK